MAFNPVLDPTFNFKVIFLLFPVLVFYRENENIKKGKNKKGKRKIIELSKCQSGFYFSDLTWNRQNPEKITLFIMFL